MAKSTPSRSATLSSRRRSLRQSIRSTISRQSSRRSRSPTSDRRPYRTREPAPPRANRLTRLMAVKVDLRVPIDCPFQECSVGCEHQHPPLLQYYRPAPGLKAIESGEWADDALFSVDEDAATKPKCNDDQGLYEVGEDASAKPMIKDDEGSNGVDQDEHTEDEDGDCPFLNADLNGQSAGAGESMGDDSGTVEPSEDVALTASAFKSRELGPFTPPNTARLLTEDGFELTFEPLLERFNSPTPEFATPQLDDFPDFGDWLSTDNTNTTTPFATSPVLSSHETEDLETAFNQLSNDDWSAYNPMDADPDLSSNGMRTTIEPYMLDYGIPRDQEFEDMLGVPRYVHREPEELNADPAWWPEWDGVDRSTYEQWGQL